MMTRGTPISGNPHWLPLRNCPGNSKIHGDFLVFPEPCLRSLGFPTLSAKSVATANVASTLDDQLVESKNIYNVRKAIVIRVPKIYHQWIVEKNKNKYAGGLLLLY